MYGPAPVYVTAYYCGGLSACRVLPVIQFDNGIDQWIAHGVYRRAGTEGFFIVSGIETVCTFFHIPAIIAAFFNDAHFLIQYLACITGKQLVRSAHIKREAERIAETISIGLIEAGFVHKGIIGRNAIGAAAVYIDA